MTYSEKITDEKHAENVGFLLGFAECAKIQDTLSLTAFFAGVLIGSVVSFFVAISIL